MKLVALSPSVTKMSGSLKENARTVPSNYRLLDSLRPKTSRVMSLQGKENDQQRNELADVQQARLYRRA